MREKSHIGEVASIISASITPWQNWQTGKSADFGHGECRSPHIVSGWVVAGSG